jgi:Flp pilus assembly protein TadD
MINRFARRATGQKTRGLPKTGISGECWMAAAILLLLVCVLRAAAQQPASPPRATPVRESDAVCANCHKQIYDQYMSTPMANASGLAEQGAIPGTYASPVSGVNYQIVQKDGAVWLAYGRPGDKNLHGQQKLEYFMGSGNHARTYLYSINGYWFESPMVYYSEKHGYDMRPSLQAEKEMPFNLPQNFECMRCHMSGVRLEDPGTRNHYSGLPFLHGGIACEDCHGDSSAHVASGGKTSMMSIAKLDSDRQTSICLLCHLEGDVSVAHLGRSLVNYRPGDDIADYMSYFVLTGARAANRGVSQVEGLYLSQCKRVSGPKMSCMTCHDPHYSPPAQEKTAFYRSKCLMCHSEGKYRTAHFSNQPDCTSCHMPKREAPDLAHSAWTDHRILANPEAAFTAQPAEAELTPVLGVSSKATARDVALAYYYLATSGDASAAMHAWTLLPDVVSANPRDSEAVAALGFLNYLRGDRGQAATFYRSVLSLDPDNYNVAIDLGVLLARTESQRAAELWSNVFQKNQDVTELGMNIATLQCDLGSTDKAEAALETVLVYSPDHRAARDELSQLEAGGRTCPPARTRQ